MKENFLRFLIWLIWLNILCGLVCLVIGYWPGVLMMIAGIIGLCATFQLVHKCL